MKGILKVWFVILSREEKIYVNSRKKDGSMEFKYSLEIRIFYKSIEIKLTELDYTGQKFGKKG